jgi:hypothetical protein
MSKEAMKLALEALEINLVFLRNVRPFKGQEDLASDCVAMTEETISSIEEALAAEQEQRSDSEQLSEPVACDNCKKLEDELEHLRIKSELWKRDAIVWKSAYDVEVGFCEQEQGGPVAKAWAEGYRMGIADERTSEANIGIAGFNAKVEPDRQNPYGPYIKRHLVEAPQQRTWVGLTDDDIEKAYEQAEKKEPYIGAVTRKGIAEAFEQILKEKNT